MRLISFLFACVCISSCVNSMPSRIPKCIEGANPFDWPCKLEAGLGPIKRSSSNIENREMSTTLTLRTIQFSDTFNHGSAPTASENATYTFSEYPQGLALQYPGFVLSELQSSSLLMPSPPQVLLTNAMIQYKVARQPGIIRQDNTSSFDLRSARFACVYLSHDDNALPCSCLVTFACQPKISKNAGTPSGHRPTPREMVRSTFEFQPSRDTSSLSWPDPQNPDNVPPSIVKASIYTTADLGGDFYDLDHCYVMLQQYATDTLKMDMTPAVMIDDIIGVAYYGEDN